jgi:ABC-type multidrug transport system permease subunit
MILAVMSNKSPVIIISSLGAVAAVLMDGVVFALGLTQIRAIDDIQHFVEEDRQKNKKQNAINRTYRWKKTAVSPRNCQTSFRLLSSTMFCSLLAFDGVVFALGLTQIRAIDDIQHFVEEDRQKNKKQINRTYRWKKTAVSPRNCQTSFRLLSSTMFCSLCPISSISLKKIDRKIKNKIPQMVLIAVTSDAGILGIRLK